MSLEKAVVIIPCYNEAQTIENTIIQTFAETKHITEFDISILIFDSASSDGTQQIVLQLQKTYPNLFLQTEPEKTGLGSAYLQAMRYALSTLQADVIIEFDADLSHQPKYLSPMLEAIKSCDVVVGSRYVAGGGIPSDWGWHRKFLSVLGNQVARSLLTRRYKDFTSGFRATRRASLEKALPEAFISNAYAYKLELLWRLHQNKASIKEYPIVFVDRQQGYSKLPANSIIDSLRVLGRLRFAKLFSSRCRSYIRMCLVGSVGLWIQLIVYNALRGFLTPLHASQIAVGAAIINNYCLNNTFTFKHPTSWTWYHKIKSVVLFAGYSAGMIFFQSYWLHFILKQVGSGFWKENLAVLIGVVLCSILNFVVYSRIVWQQHKQVFTEPQDAS